HALIGLEQTTRFTGGHDLPMAAEEGAIYGGYEDIKGFCYSATLDEIREHEYVLTPGRYVGIEEVEDDGVPFEEKMENLTSELSELFTKSRRLEEEIRKNLGGIGYEV
ncbi:N-6 DNA methylase, partial [Tissierella praeacuta]|uniref:N-6 DNA methylase n=1 Tax=Tissierella praeacuta TaxID=43131 RepID=UPI0028A73589